MHTRTAELAVARRAATKRLRSERESRDWRHHTGDRSATVRRESFEKNQRTTHTIAPIANTSARLTEPRTAAAELPSGYEISQPLT